MASPNKALSVVGLDYIKRKDIPQIIKKLSTYLNISHNQIILLGSAGKTELSGDLDIALNIVDINISAICEQLHSNKDIKAIIHNNGTNIVSFAIPSIYSSYRYHQIDIMLSTNIEWLKFSYFSPGSESEYKGSVRTALLMGVTTMINQLNYDWSLNDNTTGKLIFRAGRTFDLNRGIRRIFQYRKQTRNGNWYSKMTSIDMSEFVEKIPCDIKLNKDKQLISEPHSALALMFDWSVIPEDVRTTEQIIKLLPEFFSAEEINTIYARCMNRLKSVSDRISIPLELKNAS